MRRVWIVVLVALLGLSLGLTYAWLVNPVEYTDTEIADLKEAHRADYVSMVSDAYALTGNLNVARERLGRLGVPDVAALVLSCAESALTDGAAEAQVSRLTRLAEALRASGPAPVPTP